MCILLTLHYGTESIAEIWQKAVRSVQQADSSLFSIIKLQHDLTRSIEAYVWMKLFNSCGRYQQATLTTLTLNPSTNAWLTALPLSSQPGYRMRDEQFRLAVRHRLGQLPFDDIRSEVCTGCGRRNIDAPLLLDDPDHAHSCGMQHGRSVKQRHDALKQVLAELARSCGYHVEVEPQFPTIVEMRLDESSGRITQHIDRTNLRGDLLFVRNNVRQLIDVTVVRPTTLTLLGHGSTTGGSHIVPLVAASAAEKTKHDKYDTACARHGWKLVPFAMESLGAVGSEATRLLASMSSHSTDKSPDAFLQHAHRMLSIALQTGNATVSSQGTADLLMHSIRRGGSDLPSTNELGRGPGRNHLRRAANAAAENSHFGSIVHADYRSVSSRIRSSSQRITHRTIAHAALTNTRSVPIVPAHSDSTNDAAVAFDPSRSMTAAAPSPVVPTGTASAVDVIDLTAVPESQHDITISSGSDSDSDSDSTSQSDCDSPGPIQLCIRSKGPPGTRTNASKSLIGSTTRVTNTPGPPFLRGGPVGLALCDVVSQPMFVRVSTPSSRSAITRPRIVVEKTHDGGRVAGLRSSMVTPPTAAPATPTTPRGQSGE